jgi:hypothetical protein
MQKFIHISTISVLLLMMVFGFSCNNPTNSESPESVVEDECEWSSILPESRPADFNLVFKYGYDTVNKNVLNTFNGTYTWDMVVDPPVTIDLSLSDEEMDSIYQKMLEINFFCYPDKFVIPVPYGGSVHAVTPYQGYYFRVECNNKVKVLRWEDYILNENDDAKNLRRVISLIRSIIRSKDEYWELPSPEGLRI